MYFSLWATHVYHGGIQCISNAFIIITVQTLSWEISFAIYMNQYYVELLNYYN